MRFEWAYDIFWGVKSEDIRLNFSMCVRLLLPVLKWLESRFLSALYGGIQVKNSKLERNPFSIEYHDQSIVFVCYTFPF